jgi:hypothetical protein
MSTGTSQAKGIKTVFKFYEMLSDHFHIYFQLKMAPQSGS